MPNITWYCLQNTCMEKAWNVANSLVLRNTNPASMRSQNQPPEPKGRKPPSVLRLPACPAMTWMNGQSNLRANPSWRGNIETRPLLFLYGCGKKRKNARVDRRTKRMIFSGKAGNFSLSSSSLEKSLPFSDRDETKPRYSSSFDKKPFRVVSPVLHAWNGRPRYTRTLFTKKLERKRS